MSNIAQAKKISNNHARHGRPVHYQLNGWIDREGVFARELVKDLQSPDSITWMLKADNLTLDFKSKYGEAAFEEFSAAHTEETYKDFCATLKSYLETAHSPA